MIFEFSNYRSFLRSELTRRIEKNPSYTMRAFAISLGIAPSMLTSIFHFKRNLSQLKAYQVARKLGLSDVEAEYFSLLVQRDSTKSEDHRASLVSKIHALNPRQRAHCLEADRFRVIAQWYHLPILDMTELTDFEVTVESAARKLGISEFEAQEAIERLERLGLIRRDEKGSYGKVHDNLLVASQIPDAGLKQFYAQMLQKGIESLETQALTERYAGSLTVAFDPDQLPAVRQLINECLAKVDELASKGAKRTKVYHMDTIFFDLTHGSQSKPSKEAVL